MTEQPKGISNTAMAAILLLEIAAAVLVYAYFETRLPETDPYHMCQVAF